VHVAVRSKYKQERSRLRATLQRTYKRPIDSWLDLYKQDEAILQAFLTDLEQLRLRLIASGLLFVPPEGLGPIASGRSYDAELVHLVGTYGLDSNDALMLMEAQRIGVHDIVTLDADMRRAQADFNIYMWL
jgi:predicted nucleic acid-binding protein